MLDTRQQIYETAKTLFYKNGYSATTMRKIAQTAGISLGLPIYYFGSKESLGVEIYKEYRTELRKVCQKLYPQETHAQECRHLAVLADSALLLETPSLKELFVNISHSPEMGDYMQQLLIQKPQENEPMRRLRLLNSLTVSTVKASIISADVSKFDVPVSRGDLLTFLFYRYITLQEPESRDVVTALFERYYADYQRFNFRLLDGFRLIYDASALNGQ